MLDRDPLAVHTGTLEALQSQQHGPSRRTRPPDIALLESDENRVPLRADKASRRESRLGNFKNMFARSKGVRDSTVLPSPREITSSSSRASANEEGRFLYSPPLGTPSEHSTAPSHTPLPLMTVLEGPTGNQPIQTNYSVQPMQQRPIGSLRAVPPAKATRGPLASWNPPPLFKAFPQATKYMTLPATSLPVDTILRMHERRLRGSRDGNEPTNTSTMNLDDDGSDKAKTKKKHRRNTSGSLPKLGWTNKIYVLVTSGYLLQYAAEGPFDRLPEKILHLGSNSAAFASDVIPGRHWVIQVSSAMDAEAPTPTPDSRSLFSRLPFRTSDRRHASNFIMVFETAEDMESWISTLRREIEILGGKKSLTETGKPKVESEVLQLREQPSQRTLVVRDATRFSRAVTPWEDFEQESSVDTITENEGSNDQALDDISTTNSFVSHDGRQLDSLRDSSNRLSLISSGQRTVVTSAGSSSPDASPVTDSFPHHFDEKVEFEPLPPPEARPRPNAAAILDRRASMQIMGPFIDPRNGPPSVRPQSIYGPGGPNEAGTLVSSQVPPPNFSVPHSSSRRFSYVKTTVVDHGVPSYPVIRESESCPRLSARRAPPPPLPPSRPTSMATDKWRAEDMRPLSPTEEELFPPCQSDSQYDLPPPLASRRSSLMPLEEAHVEVNRPVGSRRLSNIRASIVPSRTSTAPTRPGLMQRVRSRPSLPGLEEAPRCRSSLELRRGETPGGRSRSQKRASIQSVSDLPPPLAPELLPLPAPPPSVPLPPIPSSASNPHLRADAQGKVLLSRRSMPHLNEGPPPLPPPTCALPPIPPQLRV